MSGRFAGLPRFLARIRGAAPNGDAVAIEDYLMPATDQYVEATLGDLLRDLYRDPADREFAQPPPFVPVSLDFTGGDPLAGFTSGGGTLTGFATILPDAYNGAPALRVACAVGPNQRQAKYVFGTASPASGITSVRVAVRPGTGYPGGPLLALEDNGMGVGCAVLKFNGTGTALQLYSDSRQYDSWSISGDLSGIALGADGPFTLVELLYDETGAAPVACVYIDGGLVAALTSTTAEPWANPAVNGANRVSLYTYTPDEANTSDFAALSIADHFQGV